MKHPSTIEEARKLYIWWKRKYPEAELDYLFKKFKSGDKPGLKPEIE